VDAQIDSDNFAMWPKYRANSFSILDSYVMY